MGEQSPPLSNRRPRWQHTRAAFGDVSMHAQEARQGRSARTDASAEDSHRDPGIVPAACRGKAGDPAGRSRGRAVERDDPGARIWSVIERFQAEDVHAACTDLGRGRVRDLAKLLDVPDAVLTRDDSAARVVRRKLRCRGTTLTLAVARLLADPTRALVATALGADRSISPSVDDLLEVLPAAIGAHGTRRVALLLAVAVDDKWPAATACDEILTTDQRFALDVLGPVVDDGVTAPRTTPRHREPEHEVKQRRRARKQQRKEQRRREDRGMRRHRVKARADLTASTSTATVDDDTASATTARDVAFNGALFTGANVVRRPVRIVHAFPCIDRDDPLVGRIVLANIRYNGPIKGAKDRPCVVIAASGRDHLVVRTCYSEGGRRAGDFRSIPVSDLEYAGLDRPTFVNFEERRIHRSAVKTMFGWLPIADWNQL